MGKKGSGNYSWLTVVKRAFRSPTKKSSRRRHEEFEDPEEEEKKREKKRWLFRKPSSSSPFHHHTHQTQTQIQPKVIKSTNNPKSVNQLHIAAATIIQTAFRGYVARRAMVALKGIVKLQALIRGQNVRKQAKMTLKCMQALLRVQARLRDQHSILPNDGDAGTGGRKSMFAHCNNLWESRYHGEIRERKSTSSTAAAAKRERCLSSVFSHQQTWENDDEKQQENTNWLDKWMSTKQWDTITNASRGTATAAGSTDNFIKTVEIDDFSTPNYSGKYQRPSTPGSYYYSVPSPGSRRNTSLNYNSSVPSAPTPTLIPSRSPSTTTTKNKVRSCSPRRPTKEEKGYSYSTANTPSSALRSLQRRLNSVNGSNNLFCRYSTSTAVVSGNANGVASEMVLPSYMAATESAKARARSQSAPRQRPSTPEREQRGGSTSVRKRLLFPVPPVDQQAGGYYYTNTPYGGGAGGFGTTTYTAAPVGVINNQNLRSPSLKSLQAGYVGMEQQSNQSCYTDSIGGEISPCSTTDLRRWLR